MPVFIFPLILLSFVGLKLLFDGGEVLLLEDNNGDVDEFCTLSVVEVVYEKLESSLDDLLFKKEYLLSSDVFVSFKPFKFGDKLLAYLSLFFGFLASSFSSSFVGIGGKSGG